MYSQKLRNNLLQEEWKEQKKIKKNWKTRPGRETKSIEVESFRHEMKREEKWKKKLTQGIRRARNIKK